ncbi:MAG: hypothetical protein ACI8UO_002870 [Verrucomicrobiales bacterium]|jgi:hypothetical protein
MLDEINQQSWNSRDGIRSLVSDADLQPPEAHMSDLDGKKIAAGFFSGSPWIYYVTSLQ